MQKGPGYLERTLLVPSPPLRVSQERLERGREHLGHCFSSLFLVIPVPSFSHTAIRKVSGMDSLMIV